MSQLWTESTLLDVVDEEGRTGFMLRIARHVDEGVAWLWLVTYGPEGVHGFVEDTFACSPARTADDGSSARYEVQLPTTHGSLGWISRIGSAAKVTGGSCEVRVRGHRGPDIAHGPGGTEMAIRASFAPVFGGAGSNLPGRTESVVRVVAEIEVGGMARSISGLGQFHEQLQGAPRFDTPFTYLSLRSSERALVALRGPRAGGGVLHGRGSVVPIMGFEIDPLDPAAPERGRRFSSGESTGVSGVVVGSVTPMVTYSVPVLHGRRPSAIVVGTLNGSRVSGFVNDWAPPVPDAPPREAS
jgi:hypothetical protein